MSEGGRSGSENVSLSNANTGESPMLENLNKQWIELRESRCTLVTHSSLIACSQRSVYQEVVEQDLTSHSDVGSPFQGSH